MAANKVIGNNSFRFVSVRAVNSPENDALSRRYVNSFINQAAITNSNVVSNPNAPQTTLLILELPKLLGNQKAEDEMIRLVTQFNQSSNLRLSLNDLEKKYPVDLYAVYLWFRDNREDKNELTLNNLSTRIAKAVGGATVNAFVTGQNYFADKLALWENIIAQYIQPDPTEFLDKLQDMARWFWIMEKIAKVNGLVLNDNIKDINEAMDATVILPDEVLHINQLPVPEPDPNTPPVNEDRDKDMIRLKNITDAETEIKNAYTIQVIDETHAAKYCEDRNREDVAPTLSMAAKIPVLAARKVNALSERTHSVIDSYKVPKTEGLDISHVNERIIEERNKILDKYNTPSKPPVVVNINNRIFQVDNLCVPEVVILNCLNNSDFVSLLKSNELHNQIKHVRCQ